MRRIENFLVGVVIALGAWDLWALWVSWSGGSTPLVHVMHPPGGFGSLIVYGIAHSALATAVFLVLGGIGYAIGRTVSTGD